MPSETRLVKEPGYVQVPTLKYDEELVEYRRPDETGSIECSLSERIIFDNNVRSQPGARLRTKEGQGRYVVKKKKHTKASSTGLCALCGEPYVLGYLEEHYDEDCPVKKGSLEQAGFIYRENPTVEVNMAEQKPLSYKRDTLIEALRNAVTENENKRAEDKRKKQEKDKKAVDQLIAAIKDNPRFAGQMLCQAAALAGSQIHTSDDVGTDAFKESISRMYPDLDEIGLEPDADLKKLIRVYEKAEDETVEVHVHDTVYNYL